MAWHGRGVKLIYKEFVSTVVQSNHTQDLRLSGWSRQNLVKTEVKN
jgi:hypothetical protein